MGVRGQLRLESLCPLAEAAGLRPEMPLAQARAICPELEVAEADPAGDLDALRTLAAWAERYTPLAIADPPDGLVLDIAGCAHLFGDEAGLAGDLRARLVRGGIAARVAVAGTLGAAWALARAATARADVTVLAPGQEAAALAPLPPALLRLEPRSVAGLARLGLRSVAELARLPRADLVARFGPLPALRLDQALGHVAEAVPWPHPAAPWEERVAFAEPIGTPEDLHRALRLLARRLGTRLAQARLGGQAFAATFLRVDGVRPALTAAAALPVNDPGYVAKLLGAKLDTLDPGFGIDAVVLAAKATAPLAPMQRGLDPSQAGDAVESMAETLDALASCLGEGRVWRPAPFPSHVPERSLRRLLPLAAPPPLPAWPKLERPLRLLRRPEPVEAVAPVPDDPPMLLRWRGRAHRVRAAEGPERIAAEWWRRRAAQAQAREEADLVRDYYRVELVTGQRLWLFRTGRSTGTPHARWFLHGVFG